MRNLSGARGGGGASVAGRPRTVADMTKSTNAQLGFVAVVGIVLVALAGVVIRVNAGNGPVGIDLWWHDLLASFRVPALNTIALALNLLGGTVVMTLVTAATIAVLLIARRFRAAITLGVTVAGASAICSILKFTLARPRPPGALVDTVSDSFPSGHVTTAAAFSVALVLSNPRVWGWVIASVWIVVMALSRTYLLVHWTSDVIAAAVLGISVALLVRAIADEVFRTLRERSLQRTQLSG